MRWRLILEEFSPELIYNNGSNNILADALSGLDKMDNLNNTSSGSNNSNNIVESTLESLKTSS